MYFKRHQKIVIWIIVIAFLIGGVGLIGLERAGVLRGSQGGKGEATVAARVNGARILPEILNKAASDFANQVQAYYQQMGQDTTDLLSGASGAMFRLQMESRAMQELIRQALYTQEADRRKVRVPENEIDATFSAQYNALLENYKITEADLASYLQAQGTSLSEWKSAMRTNLAMQLRDQALREAIVTPVEPTDEDLQEYFEKNISRYDKPEEIRASHILVQDRAKAEAILKRLRAGEDFATLAKENSTDTASAEQGGDLGWFSHGKMVKEFEDAAFALNVGETSDIVSTQYGYHIIRLTERRASSTPTFEETKDQVKTDYVREKEDEQFNSWYEQVYAQARVEIDLPLVKAYLTEQKDLALGLAEFERIKAEGTSDDPYLPYYIGRIYESKLLPAEQEKKNLEEKPEKTPEDTARIEELSRSIDDYKAKALALYLEALEKVDPDETFLNRVLALEPNNTTALYLSGKILLEQGNAFAADLKFRDVIRTDPTYVAAYVASGDVAASQSNYAAAINQYTEALKLRPGDVGVIMKLVTVYLASGKLDEAEGLLSQVERLDPQNPKLLIGRGDLAYERLVALVAERRALESKQGRTAAEEARLKELPATISSLYKSAIDDYEQALAHSGSIDLYTKLGKTYLAAGELDKAEKAFRDVIVRSPYRAEAYEGLADILHARKDIQGAIENYRIAFTRTLDNAQKQKLGEKLVELAPDDLDSRLKLAQVYAKQYMWSAAIKQYAAILAAKPDSLEAYRGIAEAYSWRTEYDTAFDYLRRGLAYASTASAKIDLYTQMITVNQQQVGTGKPLSAPGLDASLELAKIYLGQGKTAQAKEKLDKIALDAPTYRAEEVAALLAQAGGTSAPAPSGSSVQTPSNGT